VTRRAPRNKDKNHAALRKIWRTIGGSWLDITPIDGGEPDALVGWRGKDRLVEIKNPERSPSERAPRQDQLDWHRAWKGQPVAVVLCFDDLKGLFEP
jgi:hypothetical protein